MSGFLSRFTTLYNRETLKREEHDFVVVAKRKRREGKKRVTSRDFGKKKKEREVEGEGGGGSDRVIERRNKISNVRTRSMLVCKEIPKIVE